MSRIIVMTDRQTYMQLYLSGGWLTFLNDFLREILPLTGSNRLTAVEKSHTLELGRKGEVG